MKSFYHSNESFTSQSRPKYGSFTSRLREIRSHLTLLILFLTVFSGNVWAATSTTLYFCPGLCGKNWTTPYVNVCTKWNSESDNNWSNMAMSEVSGVTVDGYKVYSKTFTDEYDGARTIEFHASENNYDGSLKPVNTSWTGVATYNGKLCNAAGDGWIDYVIDYSASVSAGTDGDVSPKGTVSLKAISGTTLTATPTNSTTHAFTGWTISGGGITPNPSTTNPETFKATETGGSITANFAPRWAIKGGDTDDEDEDSDEMGDWKIYNNFTYITTNLFVQKITLAASTKYKFKVVQRGGTDTWYGNDGSNEGTFVDWDFETEKNNVGFTTTTAGEYTFVWNTSTMKLSVYTPEDAAKLILPKQSYIYLDGVSTSGGIWKADKYDARFWFKYISTQENINVGGTLCDFDNAIGVDYMYYVQVPNNDYAGFIQIDRRDPDHPEAAASWNTSSVVSSYSKGNAAYNCLRLPNTGEWSGTTPTWVYYRPPMSEVTLSDNGTTLNWGGNGELSTPYLIPTGSKIKLSATSTSTVPDDANMVAYYKFYNRDATIKTGSTSATYDYPSASVTDSIHRIAVQAYNRYGGGNGDALTSDTIYYETRTPYDITYNKGTGGSGTRAKEIKLKDVTFTLPNSAVFTKTGYKQTGWTTSDLGSQTHALGGSYADNAAQSFYPVWTPKTCTVTFDKNGGSTGSDDATATYDAALPDITPPTRSGYTFDGYWDAEEGDDGTGNQYYNADGTSAATWNKDTESTTTLYAKWIPIYTVTWSVNGDEWTSGSPTTRVTSGLKVSTFPTEPTTIDCDDLKKFVGWKASAIDGTSVSDPGGIFTDVAGSPTITRDITFYAVFAEQDGPNVGTVLWSEDWAGFEDKAKPTTPGSGATVYGSASITYSCVNGTGTGSPGNTWVKQNDSDAGGTAPELMVGAKGTGGVSGYLSISGLRSEGATELTLSFKRKNALTPTVSSESGTEYSISKVSGSAATDTYVYTITCGSAETFSLLLTAGASNVRLDDIVLTVKSNNSTNFVTTCAECTAAPELETPVVTSETCEGATVTASVSSFGTGDGCHIRNYGFVWGTTSTPTVDSNTGKQTWSGNINTGVTFACDIDELESASHYYVRAYAQNKCGIGYSTAQDIYTAGYKDISIETEPDKTWYWAGQTFDLTGMEVHGILADDSEEDITEDCSFTPSLETALEATDTYVTVSYTSCEDDELTINQTIAVYAPKVTVGNNSSYGTFSYNSTGLIVVNPKENKTCDLSVTSDNASIVSNGDGTYSIVNPKGSSDTIRVTVDFRNAVDKTVTYKVNGVTHSTQTVKESARATFPTAVQAPSPAYGHLVGWVTKSFYAQTDVPEFVYNHPVITDDITYYAVFSNCQRMRVDATTITNTSFDNYAFYNDTLTCSYLRKGNVTELGFLRFKKDASQYGKLYNSKSLNNIIRVEVGMSGLIDTVAVYVGSAAGTISGSKLRDSSPSSYKYGYEFPASTSYFVVQGDNKNIYDVDFIDVFYNLSGTTERYVCQTRDTKASGSWKNTATWANSTIPGENDVVRLKHDVSIYEPNKHVADIVIDTCGSNSGHLDIFWDGGLIVEDGIHVWNGSAFGPTTRRDLEILTNYSYNGGLICGAPSDNTVAQYGSYMRSYKAGTFYINQYIGVPFTEMEAYQYYGFNIFQYDATRDDWKTPDGSSLQAWTAYNFIRQYSYDDWQYFYVEGTLNLPGLGGTHTFNCNWRAVDTTSIDGVDGHQDYLFANSWTAPISITNIEESDCDKLVHTIYIFNSGYEDGESRIIGSSPGQWSAYPFKSAHYMTDTVIPAAQAFLVTATDEGASLTLDYKKHVYDPAVTAGRINTSPTRAPKRITSKEANDPTILKMVVRADSTLSDVLHLFQRGDFSNDFDNGWDGHKIFGENFAPQLYAMQGESKMAVGAVPELDETEIGFKAGTQANEYTFSFEYDEQEEPLYLYDKDTQEFTEISNESTYTFVTSDRKEHARFILTRSNVPQSPTGVEEVENETVQRAEKFMKDQQIFIRRGERTYSITGARVR